MQVGACGEVQGLVGIGTGFGGDRRELGREYEMRCVMEMLRRPCNTMFQIAGCGGDTRGGGWDGTGCGMAVGGDAMCDGDTAALLLVSGVWRVARQGAGGRGRGGWVSGGSAPPLQRFEDAVPNYWNFSLYW